MMVGSDIGLPDSPPALPFVEQRMVSPWVASDRSGASASRWLRFSASHPRSERTQLNWL